MKRGEKETDEVFSSEVPTFSPFLFFWLGKFKPT